MVINLLQKYVLDVMLLCIAAVLVKKQTGRSIRNNAHRGCNVRRVLVWEGRMLLLGEQAWLLWRMYCRIAEHYSQRENREYISI